MKVLFTPTFQRYSKKLHPNQKKALDASIHLIMQNPNIGEAKKGDLAGIFVYKYSFNEQLWLLAYSFDAPETITLRLVGSHENFYRTLKRN
jgi:mRNA interferase RelE/StbE